MANQEFFEQWRSKILSIPGLPLEGLKEVSNNNSLYSLGKVEHGHSQQATDKRIEMGAKQDHPNHSSGAAGHRFASNKGFNMVTPRENSFTVSMVEEDEDVLRVRFKEALQDEQMKNQRLKNLLGVRSGIIEENIGTHSSNNFQGSKLSSRASFELYKVSDILNSALIRRNDDRRKAISNLFKYRRGASVISPRQCQLYMPNEGVSRFQEPTEYLKCKNCGMSMNSHLYLKFKVAFNDKALEYLRGLLFYQEMINDTDIVVLIGTGLGENRFNQASRENTLNMFLQQLSTCGLKVKDISRMSGRDMKIRLYSKFLIMNCPLDEKDQFEDYIQHPEMKEDDDGSFRLTIVLRDVNDEKQLRKREMSEKLLNRVHSITNAKMPKLVGKRNKNHTFEMDSSVFYAVLLSVSQLENYQQLKATLNKLEPIFEESGIRCFSSSEDRKEAVIDKQAFFPYLFKAERKVNIHFPSQASSDVLFEEVNKFHDICELNSTMVVFKQFSTLTSLEIEEAFQKNDELKKQPMLKQVLTSNKSIATTLTYSFQGISTKDLGKSDQHIYKIAQPEIVDCLRKLFFKQGDVDYKIAVVVLRPFVVSNSLEELFLNVYRLNNFTILKRVYKKLDQYELNYLAKLENIEEASFQNYCTMMTLAPVCVVAMANYSGVALASFLADGYRDIENSSKYSDNSPDSLQSDTTILANLLLQSRQKQSKDILEDFLASDISNSYVSLNNIINYSLSFYHDLAYDIVPNLQEEKTTADRLLNHRKVLRYFESYREFASNITFFNPNIFVPNFETAATELISVFLPDVLTKSSGMVVMHPKASHLYEGVVELLVGLGYDVTWEATGFLDMDRAIELRLYYQSKGVVFNGDLLDIQWSSQFFRILRVSRAAGRIELKRIFCKRS